MRRYSQSTPCPSGDNIASAPFPRRARVSFVNDPRTYGAAQNLTELAEDTANVDFTTEFRVQQLRNVKPRRPTAGMGRRRASFDPAADIWQDVGREEEGRHGESVGRFAHETGERHEGVAGNDRRTRRDSILGRPAMRIPGARGVGQPSIAEYPQPVQPAAVVPQIAAGFPQPRRRRRSSIMSNMHVEDTTTNLFPHFGNRKYQEVCGETLKKDPRRRTIFIPSEDTTMFTIHPGAPTNRYPAVHRRPRSPDIGLDLVTLSEEEPENVDPKAQAVGREKRPPRKSLAVKPKRIPLQQSRQGEANIKKVEDVGGQGGGKENIPPSKVLHLDLKSGPADIVIHFDDLGGKKSLDTAAKQRPDRQSDRSVFSGSHAEQTKRDGSQALGKKRAGSQSLQPGSPAKASKAERSAPMSSSFLSKAHPAPVPAPSIAKTVSSTKRPPPPDFRPDPSKWRTMSSITMEHRSVRQVEHPLITDDLTHPELYEDHWLSHQEIALTQLFNHLLEHAQSQRSLMGDSELILRRKMLTIYHEEEMVLLYKRLQASLLYGALAVPKDMITQLSRLKDDVGLRRKFLNIWLDTYDHTACRAALEVIVGREVSMPLRLSDSSDYAPEAERQAKLTRRGLERYIDAFIIRHDDATKPKADVASIGSIARNIEHHQNDIGSQAWAWRRTMTRSLVLILLLDKAKSSNTLHLSLFQRSSPHKSSASVLQSLSTMLFPSLGDVSRPLGHLGYRLCHTQYPLDEYTYTVSNIATDLRDGVLLARLVELLLFSPSTLPATTDNTITVTLPSGELLHSATGGNDRTVWVLSQHLKLPCIGRAQKVYNVQISLSAMQGLKGLPSRLAEAVTADDVVDGHREKTLGLLWSLVGKCGLEMLLDWKIMKREIRRLQDLRPPQDDESDLEDSTDGGDDLDRYTKMIQSWARSIGYLHGIEVRNLTTSFADGRVFEAIVDEYIQYIPQSQLLNHSLSNSASVRSSRPTLSSKLRSIGCSASFLSLFTPSSPNAVSIPSKSFTISTLAYLASRLLPLTVTHRAAVSIQRWYRRSLTRRNVPKRVRLMRLASDCATVVNTRARVVHAACVLQQAWRRVLDERVQRMVKDVVALQARIRGRRVRTRMGRVGGRERKGGW